MMSSFNKRSLFSSLLLTMVLSLGGCTGASPQPAAPLRILLITGGGWHDYQTQEPLLIDGLNQRIDNIHWTVVHEGNQQPDHLTSLLQQDNWTTGYDLVIHNTGFGRVEDSDFVEHFVREHQHTPAVLIHAAVHSYRHAEPAAEHWFDFSGVQSMWHEQERVFTVENLAPRDPVMQDFPASWTPPVSDELYVVEKIRGDITPLAHAYGEDTEAHHPVIWKHQREHNRVFVTTLGHNSAMYQQAIYMDMLAAGVRWAAGLDVD